MATRHDRRGETRNVAAADALRRREREAVLEPRSGRHAQRHRPCERVRIAVRRRRRTRRARRRRSRAPAASCLAARAASAPPSARTSTSPGRAPAGSRPSRSSRRTASASKPIPAEKLKRRPLTVPSVIRRSRPSASAAPTARAASAGSRESPSARGRTLVPPPGQEPDRKRAVGAVQRLVVGAVAREDDDRVDRVGCRRRRELGGVTGVLREARLDVDALAQRVLDRGDRRPGHLGRVRIDDEECALHPWRTSMPRTALLSQSQRRKPRSACSGSPTTARPCWACRRT